MGDKFIVYSFVGSQWAGVVHLALAEKSFAEADYDIKEIDLVAADNFNPAYLKINPNGTVPSLTSASLENPLTDSIDILRYLDGLRLGHNNLVPVEDNAKTKQKVQAILDLVHSDDLGTNLILLQARDAEEMQHKKNSDWKTFLEARQTRLEKERVSNPGHPFYGLKAQENGQLYKLYVTDIGPEHQLFFKKTHEMYRSFAAGMEKLEALLVLPYAAGDTITEADWHVAPWLSHAMAGAGTNPSEIQDFKPLERLIQKSVSGFTVGPKTREWWANVAATGSFKKVFPTLH
ncbi:hypothetical protein B0J13DRAFT_612900 [Dactylonectria estremocensis]|uniref:GST N-terminal domain-containing protein n=1 Tax=Dactylonectria estremocensis TaxID=1079267 RepID=A0A9P9DI24_9HYPO|nr:hypothetical protein B0J13DRAFT_612900 [Dactylonectria estremocensis]